MGCCQAWSYCEPDDKKLWKKRYNCIGGYKYDQSHRFCCRNQPWRLYCYADGWKGSTAEEIVKDGLEKALKVAWESAENEEHSKIPIKDAAKHLNDSDWKRCINQKLRSHAYYIDVFHYVQDPDSSKKDILIVRIFKCSLMADILNPLVTFLQSEDLSHPLERSLLSIEEQVSLQKLICQLFPSTNELSIIKTIGSMHTQPDIKTPLLGSSSTEDGGLVWSSVEEENSSLNSRRSNVNLPEKKNFSKHSRTDSIIRDSPHGESEDSIVYHTDYLDTPQPYSPKSFTA